MAKLVDALGSGPSGSNSMRVQVSLRVIFIYCKTLNKKNKNKFIFFSKKALKTRKRLNDIVIKTNSEVHYGHATQ